MTKLRDDVTEFMTAFGQATPAAPCIPDDKTVLLRCRLIVEETFEALAAATEDHCLYAGYIQHLGKEVMAALNNSELTVDVDIVEFTDALADIQFVTEGSFVACGIDSGPVLDEVARSNRSKFGGPIRDDGKVMKRADWSPPELGEVLRKQGWQG